MKGKHLNSGQRPISQRGAEEVAATQVTRGDLIWVGLNGGSWWPAQVVDDNNIGGSIKPGTKSAGKVLVRLYGSYRYLYVDPIKCHSEFKRILKQNNGCYQKIFEKALEQDRPRSNSGRSKRQGSKSKENVRIDASRDQSNQTPVKDQDIEASNYETTLFGKSPELSARRMKVMQNLGLIAPSGSPFHKNGHVYLRLC